jgi:general secretion pathway protein D
MMKMGNFLRGFASLLMILILVAARDQAWAQEGATQGAGDSSVAAPNSPAPTDTPPPPEAPPISTELAPTPEAPSSDSLPAVDEPTPRPVTPVPPRPSEKLYELKFSAAPLDQVLRFYSDLTERTLLEAPANAKVTITLRSQSKLNREETLMALKSILAMNGIGLVNLGEKFVKVVPVTSLQQEGLQIRQDSSSTNRSEVDDVVSEVINLKYIETADAQKAITGLLHSYGKIVALERINALLVADSVVNIVRMREILDQVDQPLELKEELHIVTISHAKASDIKTKLTEIIQEAKGQQKAAAPTVARPAMAGPPGVIRATRQPTAATVTTTTTTTSETGDTAGANVIRGEVRMVADDRTGILILITRPENMKFFNGIIKALDVATEPDFSVKVVRLEYADAESVSTMLNNLIGAAQPKDAPKSSAAKSGEAGDTPKEGRSTALQDYLQQRDAAAQSAAQSVQAGALVGKSKIGELSSDNIKIMSDKRINGVVIMASKRDMETVLEILKGMDIMLSQVLIEAVIVQLSLTKDSARGVDWLQRSMIAYNKSPEGKSRPIMAYTGGGGGAKATPIDATRAIDATSTGGGLTYFMTYFDLNLDVVVKLTASDSDAKVLSSPIILAQDNKEAKIEVSTEKYFYKGVRAIGNTTTGGQQFAPDVESRKVGLSLIVTPRINEKGFVVMDIKQTIENLGDDQEIEGQLWPTVLSRDLSASVAVQNRETIVMGGLMENSGKDSATKIPFFGDIPLLGNLFRSNTRNKERKEILVFITPYVLNSPAEIQAEAIRRKAAMGENGAWTRGWSDSQLGDDTKETLAAKKKAEKDAKKKALEAEKAAKKNPKKDTVAPSKATETDLITSAQTLTTDTNAVNSVH